MNRGLAATIPVAMWHAGRKYDQGAWARNMTVACDLQVHRPAQDVEDLIDLVRVHTRRRPFAGRGLDAVDAAGGRARVVIQQRLAKAFLGRRKLGEVDLA